ncbi:hypothetical protein D9C73_008174 [Collichthys lucidus]|uniref:Sterile alpha motif domain-containing protein 3 n=1 Tax=Collichthys lucidus TaxID=240159 RepID=A0A4U5UHH4_COLLU|nr:hypothetical protein D9C73_008174 [Collichthys lucidus]
MIITYKVYLSDSEFENVAKALILKHPCLKEPGSVSGYSGWMTSLKYKLGNYRTKLRELGCPEVTVNALKQKPHGKCSPAYAVKKPKKAEVNYCPAYPTGETTQTLEMIRVALLSEVQKRNNDDKVAMMMDKTFALRREEVVREAPMIADFKTRWPALFNVQEAYSKKGGVQGKKIKSIMVPITQTDSVDVRRECVLKGLCVYLNEDPEKLVKEYMTADVSSGSTMAETVFGIFVMRHEGAEPGDAPEDVGIILEGVEVLNNLGSVPFAVAMLLALAYALNLSYPPELKYTFEALQKIIMKLDESRLSRKVQALKTYLCR